MTNTTIAEKITTYRKEKKLTQEQLGAKLGISGQAVSKWEKGESMPDILLLPKLCELFEISLDTLLSSTETMKTKNIMHEFCTLAYNNGKSQTLIDAISRMWHDNGKAISTGFVNFGPSFLRIYDKNGMGFVVNGKNFLNDCLNKDAENTADIMRTLADETHLNVLKHISITEAVTKKELSEATGLNEDSLNRILIGFSQRQIIVYERDKNGKLGYMQGEAAAGIYMILAGCHIINQQEMIRFTRNENRS